VRRRGVHWPGVLLKTSGQELLLTGLCQQLANQMHAAESSAQDQLCALAPPAISVHLPFASEVSSCRAGGNVLRRAMTFGAMSRTPLAGDAPRRATSRTSVATANDDEARREGLPGEERPCSSPSTSTGVRVSGVVTLVAASEPGRRWGANRRLQRRLVSVVD
jgi:hypothetical protein